MLTAPSPFGVEINGSSNASRWKTWYRKFMNFCVAAGITEDTTVFALFNNLAGDDIDEIVQALAKEKKKASEVYEIIAAHFQATSNTDRLIIAFRQARQRDGEGVEAFMIRLKNMAADCGFEKPDDELRLQLAMGANDSRVLQKAMEAKTELAKLYEYARQLETAKVDSRFIASALPHASVKMESTYQLHHNQCDSCGNKAHTEGERCPAVGKTCTACGKANHFRRVCRSKSRRDSRSSSSSEQHQLNQVSIQAKPDFENEFYSVFAIKSGERSSDNGCPRVLVNIGGTKVDLGIDTQASVNAISSQAYDKLAVKPKLSPYQSTVFSLDGKVPMKTRGSFNVSINANGRRAQCQLIVFEEANDSVLGFKSCMQLGLVSLACKSKWAVHGNGPGETKRTRGARGSFKSPLEM